MSDSDRPTERVLVASQDALVIADRLRRALASDHQRTDEGLRLAMEVTNSDRAPKVL